LPTAEAGISCILVGDAHPTIKKFCSDSVDDPTIRRINESNYSTQFLSRKIDLSISSSKHGCFPGRGWVFLILLLVLLTSGYSPAQEKTTSSGECVIVCMIQLEHADAEYLASVLIPFLSPKGSIVSDVHTNTMIIKDRASIVNMLAEIIKGKPCTPISQPSDIEAGEVKKESHMDQ